MRKKLQFTFYVKLKILTCLVLFLTTLLSTAQESHHIRLGRLEIGGEYPRGQLWDAKIVGSNLYFTAILADVDCDTGDDIVLDLVVELAGKQIFKITNGGGFFRLTNADDSCLNSARTKWDIATSYNYSYQNFIYEHNNNGILYITFPLPAEFLTGPITLSGSAQTDIGDPRQSLNAQLTTAVLPNMPDVRVTQGCDAVNLAWKKITIDPTLSSSDFTYQVKREGVKITDLRADATSYSIKGVTGSTSATVELYWKNELIGSNEIDGSSFDPLPIPADLQASTTKCDGSVDLRWQWSQSSPTNFVLYRSTSPTGVFTAMPDAISGSKRSYTVTGLTRGQKYYFKIAAKGGKCPGEGAKSEEAVMGISPASPVAPKNANMVMVTGAESGVKLSWNEPLWVSDDYLNATSQKYKILRKDLKKGTETTIELPIGDFYEGQIKNQVAGSDGYLLTYTDKEVSTCESYSYKIIAVNSCKSSAATVFVQANASDKLSITNIDLSRVFLANNLETSKGYFGNLVQLDWKTNENADFVGSYKIFRRALNSTIAPELQATVDKNTRTWSDNKAVAQTLYEYYVVASADCGLEKISSYDISKVTGIPYTQLQGLQGLAVGVGFRLPSAIVTGNINYAGGIEVPNVKVVAEKDGMVTGNALSFDGVNQSVIINPDQKTIAYNTTGMSVSIWAKPKAWTSKQVLASQAGVFEVALNNDRVVVTIAGTSITSKAKLTEGTYSNIFATYNNSKLILYINGKLDKSVNANGSLAANVTNPIYLGSTGAGNFYNGLLDEFRIYKAALTPEDVERDYSRLIRAETPNIVGNWRFDEGVGPFVFDASKEGGVYNKIDGDLMGATWSKEVPSREQLGFAGFTDSNGNYVIEGISYENAGENFSITPTMTLSGAIHSFSPSNRVLFLGEGRSVENNIDFIDQSSFKVTGTIRFNFDDKENDPTHFQSSGSKGVSIWLNGTQQLTKNGLPIVSNEFGQFEVVVPIGKHFLEFRKDGHTFVSNKFPATGTYDYQDILSGIEVLDNTKHTFTGCVVGGLVQANKKLGFSAYKGKLKMDVQRINNIGATYFTLTSKDTRIKRSVKTDPETGEFVIQLPPNEYEFSDVSYIGDEANPADDKILFLSKDIAAIKLDDAAAYKGIEEQEPVLISGDYVVKKVNYNAEKRLIYRSTPTMVVQNHISRDYLPNSAEVDASGNVITEKTVVGETTVKIFDKELSKDILLPTKALPYPAFLQGKEYQVSIKAVEKYEYYGTKPIKNPATDQVPVLDGQVTVSNNISAKADAGSTAAYQKADDNWVDLFGNTHQFSLQNEGSVKYNFIGGDPDLVQGSGADDSFVKSMAIALKTGDYTVYWPDPNNASKGYKAYVLGGSKMPGTDFITEAPASITTTLRIPPGSGSSVTLEKGSTITKESTSSTQAGGDWSFGVGLAWEFEAEVPVTGTKLAKTDGQVMATTYGSRYLGNEKTNAKATTTTQSLTITAADAFDKGDFFIADSKNIEIGRANNVKFILASKCIGCVGPKVKSEDGQEYILNKAETYYQKEKGETLLLYSEDHIKTDLIPKLKAIRNSLFIDQANLYVTKLGAKDTLYGVNNDDPRLKGRNFNDYTKDDIEDDKGASYEFKRALAPKINGIIQDKVRWYNNQIRAWEEILMNNEIQKFTAISENKPKQKNISISSGIAYSNTSTTETTEITVSSTELMAGASLDTEGKFLLGTGTLVGPSFNLHGGGDKTFGDSTNDGKISTVTTSYTIQDNDKYNVYSMNIYDGKGSDGPIFQIVSGQTSCPFEREKELEVTKEHPYYLQYWLDHFPALLVDKIKSIKENYAGVDDELKVAEDGLIASSVLCGTLATGNPLAVAACIAVPIQEAKIKKLKADIIARDKEIEDISKVLGEKKAIYAQLLEAFKNEQKPLLGKRTVQIEKPGILVDGNDKANRVNVPSSKAAIFDLELRNETELIPSSTDQEITYQMSVDPASNPDGLVVLLNGETLVRPVEISIPFGQKIRQTLTVLRGPKEYKYEGLTLVFESTCDETIHKEITLDIEYIPVCSEATIVSPGNNWTVNYDSKNRLPIKVGDYDVNYQGFKGIKIQYKRASESESNWKLLETFYRNDEARANAGPEEVLRKAPLLTEQGGNDFIYNWDVSKLTDDLYDVRIQSICQGESQDVVYTSPTISGIVDRVNPSSFGAPQPADGVLSSGDEIMIQFNEPINAGLLNPYNFDIRGVIQGGELRHPASVYFNGANDYMKIPVGVQLNRRSFSFDFYAKRKNSGAETLLSQGATAAQSFGAGFNSANKFEVTLAGVKFNSTKSIPADDSWVHYAYAYDANNQEAKLYINGVLDAIKQNYTPNYEAIGAIFVGKDALAQSPSFKGNMHELRFWGKALTEAEVNVVATKRLKSNEPGLLGNWPMEESEGTLVQDIARERHAQIVSGTWQVALKGNALSTTANTKAIINSPAYLDVSNFSIEFWFKGNNTTNATLLSNGRGDDQDLNKNGWSIRAGSSGLLEVWNNNKQFKATTTNFFDNQWHHFALVVDRLTNTVCFVDGKQQNTTETQAIGFSGFGGAALHLGAMGWNDIFGNTKQDQHFVGALDEVRIWQGARNALQIKRDMRYMLSGDEAGLDLYLPFDKYKTNMGIEMLEASNASAATGDTAVKENGQAAQLKESVAFMQETPLVKLPRPVRKVNFSYSANQDKIILTTADPDKVLENVILDISVTGVQDLNGNIMRAPVTWTAYVDKNQVIWIESDKNFQIETGKGLTFTNRIENTGGKVFNYNITNLPSWLTANPSSGTIGPKSSLPVTFIVDKDVNIGNYVQDILLETEFGFAEVMNLSLDVSKALPEDWKVTPSDYQYSMNFIAQLNINGDVSRDPNDQVAAFVGDQCRGIAKLRYIPALDNYQAFISVYSNTTANEAIQFRIWNASDGQVHRDVTPSYVFVSNDVKGTSMKPEMLNAVDVLEHTYELSKGWTWISAHLNFNYNPSKQFKTNDLLKTLRAENGDLIRSIDAVDSFDKQEGWLGSLTTSGSIQNGRGYKVFLSYENKLKYSGLLLKGEQVKINVVQGWNWIGFIGFKNTPINQALAGFATVKDGDVIKNQFALAVYAQNIGWIGDLTHLRPGEGYMLKTAQAGNFYYPNLSYTASGNKIKEEMVTKIPASTKYANSMNAIAEVVGDNQDTRNKLRAYVGTELRAEAAPVFNPITKKNTYFVTIYGQKNNENIRFEFVDAQNKQSFVVNESIAFHADSVTGNGKSPQLLTLVETTTINNVLEIYPNPFINKLKVKLFKGHTIAQIKLSDMQGRSIKISTTSPEQEEIEFDAQNLPNGMYLLSMYDANGILIQTEKVIK
ncbi:LamG-like jellyroll fold domain-containing protein [Flavobacterium succinicans]|uniref:Laminin G domain protein n=1 Tax=Flavobacterium succinicans TaxID=29536 RepID=A0A199XVT9_9FLAO|nr:LamG-like jellyroll fold domain-containing protein [Flavobacterium succinicans]OAZ05366.1 laminin G domain protein [Flavobacterium succinicans]